MTFGTSGEIHRGMEKQGPDRGTVIADFGPGETTGLIAGSIPGRPYRVKSATIPC